MRERIQSIIDNYFRSFDNKEDGYSRKKLIAWFLILTIVVIHIKWIWKTVDFAQLENILIIDYAFIATLLGMSTYQSVNKAQREQKKKELTDPGTNTQQQTT